jgi:hypothetical protein
MAQWRRLLDPRNRDRCTLEMSYGHRLPEELGLTNTDECIPIWYIMRLDENPLWIRLQHNRRIQSVNVDLHRRFEIIGGSIYFYGRAMDGQLEI